MDPMGDISRCYAEACPRTFMPKPPKKTVIRNRFSSFCLEKKPWFKQLTNLRFSTSAYAITIGKTTNLTSVWGTLVVGRWYLGPHCTMDIGKRLVHVKSYGDVVAVTSFVNMNTDSVDKEVEPNWHQKAIFGCVSLEACSLFRTGTVTRPLTNLDVGWELRWIVVSSASRESLMMLLNMFNSFGCVAQKRYSEI